MTCIFLNGGRLTTDSNHALPSSDATFISPTKVTPLHQPARLCFDPNDDWAPMSGSAPLPLDEIDDRIHGYAIAGSEQHGDLFMRTWRYNSPTPESELTREEAAAEWRRHLIMYSLGYRDLKLARPENCFTLILLGEKADYAYSPMGEAQVMRVLPRTQIHAFGSGAEFIFEAAALHKNTTLAMWAVMLIDEGTKGFVEEWELPTSDKPQLERLGIWLPQTRKTMRAALEGGQLPTPEFVSLTWAQQRMDQYFEAGAFLAQNPQALAKHRALKTKEPELYKHAIRLLGDNSEAATQARRELLATWKKDGKLFVKPPRKTPRTRTSQPTRSKGK